jgi:hypothetical protein
MNNPRLHFLLYKSWKKKQKVQKSGEMSDSLFSIPRETVATTTTTTTTTITHQSTTRDKEQKILKYVFIGKLTLLPLIILLLTVGAVSLLLYGDKSYFDGYFQSNEVYYGVAGIILSLLALSLVIFLCFWIVVKISFVFTPHLFVITKRGIFRSSSLEFRLDPQQTSLHYFRSHFAEKKCWLQLIVREGDKYYAIFSSRGKGNQRDRFLTLFTTLKEELKRWQLRFYSNTFATRLLPDEIVSKEEFMLISPFTARLKLLSEQRRTHDVEVLLRTRPLCIEDLNVISFDSFFLHFKYNKYVGRYSFQRETSHMHSHSLIDSHNDNNKIV